MAAATTTIISALDYTKSITVDASTNIKKACEKTFKIKKLQFHDLAGCTIDLESIDPESGETYWCSHATKTNTVAKDIVLLGDLSVGKTCLIQRYLHDNFDEGTTPTIEESVAKLIQIDSWDVHVDILDTAGLEEFRKSLFNTWVYQKDGVIFVFDVTAKSSLESLVKRHEQIRECCGENIPSIILVGNKCDLRNQRQVSESEVLDFINEQGWENEISYVEVSAKSGQGVKEAFSKMLRCTIKEEVESTAGSKKACVVS